MKKFLMLAILGTIVLSGCAQSKENSSKNNNSSSSLINSTTSSSLISASSNNSSSTSMSSNVVNSSLSSTSKADDNKYTKISDVRNELIPGDYATIKGVVVKHNYTGQSTPYITGFWMADESDCIYVYGEMVAKSVEVGNMVVIKGTKDYYIPNTDTGAASSTNYQGMLQLTQPELIENDGKTDNEIPLGVIEETTVANLSNIPLNDDISGKIYKVKGRWSKVAPADFTNYYLTDLNRVDSIMAYTQSNGKDYSWTNSYDGKTVEMLIIVSLGKPGVGQWRMCPVQFLNDNILVSNLEEATYAAERLLNLFANEYNTATNIAYPIEDELLPGCTRTISSSSNMVGINNDGINEVVYIQTTSLGKINIEAIATYNGETASVKKEIEIVKKQDYDVISIAEARKQNDGEIVTLEAIVAKVTYKQSMTPQGLFLADDTGSIFLYCGASTQDLIKDVKDGNKVTLKATIDHYIKDANNAANANYLGDFQLSNPEILNVDTNTYDIPKNSYVESSITEIMATLPENNITSNMYIVKAKVIKNVNQYSTSYNLAEVNGGSASLPLYSQNSGNDFKWLDEYVNDEVTIIIGIQNLNLKKSGSHWRGLPIKVIK